jgi:LmbE family N-acetylglucosaminyl deacetylase
MPDGPCAFSAGRDLPAAASRLWTGLRGRVKLAGEHGYVDGEHVAGCAYLHRTEAVETIMPRSYHVISPHLDDAALSCTMFLAANPGCCLTTVFAGGPASVRPLTPWDRASRYFAEGADVTAVRRAEDGNAAALINATAVHLTYWDRQYRNSGYGYTGPDEPALASVIAGDLMEKDAGSPAGAWMIPLGLGHPDHRLAADAGLLCASQLWSSRNGSQPPDVFVYEELPYAVEDDGEVAERKDYLAQRGFTLVADDTLEFSTDRALKMAVFRCHTSQRRALRRRARTAVRTPERVWRLVRG